MLATESAGMAPSAVLPLVSVITVLVIGGALAVVVASRRKARVTERVPAGGELRRDVAPAAPPARWRQRLGGPPRKRIRGEAQRRRRTAPPEPWLPRRVLLHSDWQSMVCHGYCGPQGDSRLVVRAATLRGLRHRYESTPGQDVVGVVWNPQRRSLFAVVADGLGSQPRSGDAARRAVARALCLANTLDGGADPTQIMAMAGNAVEVFNRDVGAGTSTMVVAEITRTRAETHVEVWGIGDSEAWLLRGSRWAPMHHERRPGQGNVTRHLPNREVKRTFSKVIPGSVVLLATDGFAGALGRNSPLGAELAEAWQRPPAAIDFLSHVDFKDDQFTDDRAAVAVWVR